MVSEFTTDGNLLKRYCEMVQEDMERNQTAIQTKRTERRLTLELMTMKNKDQFDTVLTFDHVCRRTVKAFFLNYRAVMRRINAVRC